MKQLKDEKRFNYGDSALGKRKTLFTLATKETDIIPSSCKVLYVNKYKGLHLIFPDNIHIY